MGFLKSLGEVIKTQSISDDSSSIENGAEAIKTALLKSVNDSEGLTLINFVRHFPNDVMLLEAKKIMAVTEKISTVQQETKAFVETVADLTLKEAYQEQKVDFSQLPDIRKKGKYSFSEQKIILEDTSRSRNFS